MQAQYKDMLLEYFNASLKSRLSSFKNFKKSDLPTNFVDYHANLWLY